MCGIAGIIGKSINVSSFDKMLDSLRHRGPDGGGVWKSPSTQAILGHRRLAIIDTSSGGTQPMCSPDGRFTITFNGEIYNYLELKKELQHLGHVFISCSDTEVLLHAYMEWGRQCLEKINGMFAFAVWDEYDMSLFAARDRLGEKPFKYYYDDEKFIFASQISTIFGYPGISRHADWQAVDIAMSFRFVPSPMTGFKNIYKLPAGHWLTYKKGELTIQPYWNPGTYARINENFSEYEWRERLWSTFVDSVRQRMISDVPIGAFLSGGLDSSSVVAAMRENTSSEIRTFSVGFRGNSKSEHTQARVVSNYFGTSHTEIFIEPDVFDGLPSLVRHFEEPFFDNSALPTMAMSEVTKKYVSVALTGDGADELLGGYPNYWLYNFVSNYHKLPKFLYQKMIPTVLSHLSHRVSLGVLKKYAYRAEILSKSLYESYDDYYSIWQKKLARTKYYITKDDLYTERIKNKISLSMSTNMLESWMEISEKKNYGNLNRAMLGDIRGRLADGYLVKVDMGAMAHALETRPPFLDHRFAELCLSLPQKYKMRNGNPKIIWKSIMKEKLPNSILMRKKQGFGLPLSLWFKNELYKDVCQRVLGQEHFKGVFNESVIEKLISDHKCGKADYSNHLWGIIVLSEWMKYWKISQ